MVNETDMAVEGSFVAERSDGSAATIVWEDAPAGFYGE